MTKIEEAEKLLGSMTQGEKAQLLQRVELARLGGRAVLTLNRRDFDFVGQEARIHAEVIGRESILGQLIRIKRAS